MELRTKSESYEMMKESEVTHKVQQGFVGITPLIQIPKYDVTCCTPVDVMHSVCLGVVKYLVEIWMDSRNNKMNYYLGLKTNIIDNRLVHIHPFTEISRYPRNITEKSQWKANEWLNWLLYFSAPCLINILPQVMFHSIL